MKHVHGLVCLGLVFCLTGVLSAGLVEVEYAELGIAQGGTAVYDALAGTIVWSGGASGQIGLSDGTFLNFYQPDAGVTIVGNVSGTPGSGSDITLTNLTFSLTFAPFGQTEGSAIVIAGSLSGDATYNESLGIVPGLGTILSGTALVDVTADGVNLGSGETYSWIESADSILETTMIGVPGFTDYNQDYLTNNLRIVVKSSAYIPEPATVTLLGFGAIGLLKRKKK